ncbi:branched-chain amino acid ABC transporter permease [Alteribacillus sp. YIM 98480]|uniref:branched-chain amino acid ABC transporter permease n=1 Tax=Alteribacillus sp. YIM 98480 TaxID=2606599 RepID=UPI001E625832|nr:branched-chain amino acid ABC transporter permease [Alteribacillus sp. YIM 98480]
MEALLQITFGGLIFGSIYALAAIGIVMIYKTTDVVNFAHGEMAMITTFISFTFLQMVGLSFFVSFLLALIFAAIFGMTVYQAIIKRVQNAPPLNQIVVTLGLFLAFNGIAGLIWGYTPHGYPSALRGDSFQVGSVFMSPHQLFILGITLALMILFFILFKYTKIGLAMRATQQDMQTSSLMGIKVSQVFNLTWAAGAILGGVAGILTAPITYLEPSMMIDILIMGFAAAVFGGFVNLPGAVIGGLIVGVYSNWVSYYIGSELSVAFVFLLIVLVLYVKPTGLFGAKYVKKV